MDVTAELRDLQQRVAALERRDHQRRECAVALERDEHRALDLLASLLPPGVVFTAGGVHRPSRLPGTPIAIGRRWACSSQIWTSATPPMWRVCCGVARATARAMGAGCAAVIGRPPGVSGCSSRADPQHIDIRGDTGFTMSAASDMHQFLDLVGAEKRQQARGLDGARWLACTYLAQQHQSQAFDEFRQRFPRSLHLREIETWHEKAAVGAGGGGSWGGALSSLPVIGDLVTLYDPVGVARPHSPRAARPA